MFRTITIALSCIAAAPAQISTAVIAPPKAEVERLQLAPFYQQYLSADGFPIVASANVTPAALYEARYLIDKMLDGRDDIRRRLIKNKVRYAIMAVDEMTTAIPEHSDLTPSKYWDRRARGLGASKQRPAVSCGEENLLRLPGDPYWQESLLLHEFAHAIHIMAVRELDKTFDQRLKNTYQTAIKAGLWKASTPPPTRANIGRKACNHGLTTTARQTMTTTTSTPARSCRNTTLRSPS